MKLYKHFRSSASHRVRIALALKGLDYDYVPVHLVMNEQLDEAFTALSASRLVPPLESDEVLLTQSLAIVEYLDETHPQPLPADPVGCARVRAIAHGSAHDIACAIHPLNNLRVLRHLVHERKLGEYDKSRWYRHGVESGLEVVERQLAARPARFCHGAMAPWQKAHAGRHHPGAADLQGAALRVPQRPRSAGDEGV